MKLRNSKGRMFLEIMDTMREFLEKKKISEMRGHRSWQSSEGNMYFFSWYENLFHFRLPCLETLSLYADILVMCTSERFTQIASRMGKLQQQVSTFTRADEMCDIGRVVVLWKKARHSSFRNYAARWAAAEKHRFFCRKAPIPRLMLFFKPLFTFQQS